MADYIRDQQIKNFEEVLGMLSAYHDKHFLDGIVPGDSTEIKNEIESIIQKIDSLILSDGAHSNQQQLQTNALYYDNQSDANTTPQQQQIREIIEKLKGKLKLIETSGPEKDPQKPAFDTLMKLQSCLESLKSNVATGVTKVEDKAPVVNTGKQAESVKKPQTYLQQLFELQSKNAANPNSPESQNTPVHGDDNLDFLISEQPDMSIEDDEDFDFLISTSEQPDMSEDVDEDLPNRPSPKP